MDIIFNIVYFVFFLGGLFITLRILLDIDLPKIFKQGRVGSIRACYIVISIIVSSLLSWSIVELMKCCYNIIK